MVLAPHLWLAAAPGAGEHTSAIFLGEILFLLLVGRLLGEVMQRLRQPAVMGQLLAGIVLGPSILGASGRTAQHALFPADPEQKKMLDAVSQLGVLMLLLLTGMETDLRLVKRVGRTAAIASVGGVVVPFACGFLLGELLPASMLPDAARRLPTSLFLATALSISSIKIVAAVLREVNFLRRDLGQVILAAAILDDTLGWIIIALIGGLAAHGSIRAPAAARQRGRHGGVPAWSASRWGGVGSRGSSAGPTTISSSRCRSSRPSWC